MSEHLPIPINVVLVEPEIPQNTGSIGRACLALGARLHLVKPLGFDISSKQVKRAGLDYWQHLEVIEHDSLVTFLESLSKDADLCLFSKKAGHTLYENWKLPANPYLVFGKETAGLPDWFIQKHPLRTVRIPIFDARVRSFNLSGAVHMALGEAVRQASAL